MTDSEKMTKLLDYYNLTPQRFAERIGLKQDTYIEDIISGKSGFRRALNMKIMKTYPEINQHWLISGEGKIVKEVRKKYEMIASHTARRSFATNAYLAGIPIARIMMLTGHQSETSFFKYIKIRGDENAEELARHAFFQL